jgi:tripartite-type tricarboxylate transporter receptor subunit TctC
VQQRFAEQGTLSAGNTPAEFASFMRDDYLRWGTVIKKARISFD